MKTMRSLSSCWKTRPEDSRSAPAAVTRGVSDAFAMATRLVGGGATCRHTVVHSLFSPHGGPAAGVAELADAPGLGPGPREGVEVQILSPAPQSSETAQPVASSRAPSRRRAGQVPG